MGFFSCFSSKNEKQQDIQLYYWQSPGKGQTIRLILEYLQIEYNETRYTPDTAMQWFGKDKNSCGSDFPNLPMLKQGDFIITEQLAISEYLGQRGQQNLNGKGLDKFKVDEIKGVVNDIFGFAHMGSQEKNLKDRLNMWKEKIVPKLQYLKKFYEDKKWAMGNYTTIADFYVYCGIMWLRESFEDQYRNIFHKYFSQFLKRFENIPTIQNYMNSDKYIPYNIKEASKLKFSYWQSPGKGQAIRFLLEYLSLDYITIYYSSQTANCWFSKDKLNKGFDFPNLPNLIHGDLKISENIAISEYLPDIAGNEKLNGEGIDKFKVDEVKNVMNDIFGLAYLGSVEKNQEGKNQIWEEKLVPKLKLLRDLYSKQKEWAVGYLTVADFYVYGGIQWVKEAFLKEWKVEFENDLGKFTKRFENIQQIKEYKRTDKYIKYNFE